MRIKAPLVNSNRTVQTWTTCENKTMTCVYFIQTTGCLQNKMCTQLSSSVASGWKKTHHNLLFFFSSQKHFQFLQAGKK